MSTAREIPIKIQGAISVLTLSDGVTTDSTLQRDQPVQRLVNSDSRADDMRGDDKFVICNRHGEAPAFLNSAEVRRQAQNAQGIMPVCLSQAA